MELVQLYRAIVETSKDGIWVFDPEGRLLHANRACAELMGVPVEGFLERTAFDFLDEQGRREFAGHLEEVRAGLFNEAEVEVQWVRPDGGVVWVLVSETPLYDENGLIGVLHRMTDYTHRKNVVAQLSRSEERLAEAQRIARIGSFTWDLASGQVTGSAGLYDLLGTQEPFGHDYDSFIRFVHEDHRVHFDRSVAQAVAAGTDAVFDVRSRGRRGWIWARFRAELGFDAAGTVVSLSGTVQDVTETVEAENALRDRIGQNRLMEAVASAANEASTIAEVLRQGR